MTEISTDKRHSYVSAVDGPRRWLLAGPYARHETALTHAGPVRDKAIEGRPGAWFYAFGTAGSDDAFATPLGAEWTP